MNNVPFHDLGEDDGHFYCLAYCSGMYGMRESNRVPATMALYFSPSPAFSRFSTQVYSSGGHMHMYHRGPDYTPCIEAAFLDLWVAEQVPPYVWHLYPLSNQLDFENGTHQELYQKARQELCLALSKIRMRAWMNYDLKIASVFSPPAEGFIPINAFASTEDNAEIMQAAVQAIDP